jgi:hypothetical protein
LPKLARPYYVSRTLPHAHEERCKQCRAEEGSS